MNMCALSLVMKNNNPRLISQTDQATVLKNPRIYLLE